MYYSRSKFLVLLILASATAIPEARAFDARTFFQHLFHPHQSIKATSDNAIRVEATIPATDNLCAPIGPQRLAVILANYPGEPLDSAVPNAHYIETLFTGADRAISALDFTDPNVPGFLQQALAGESLGFSIADFYKTVSGGKAWFESVKVVGPYQTAPFLSNQDTIGNYYRSLDTWENHLLTLAASDLDLMNIDRVVFITPEAIDSANKPVAYGAGMAAQGQCDLEYNGSQGHRSFAHSWIWANSAYQGIDVARIFGTSVPNETPDEIKQQINYKLKTDMSVIIHELGHTFGLGHANAVQRKANDEILPASNQPLPIQNYGDPLSVMSNSNLHWFNVPHLRSLGWLQPSQVPIITSSSVYRIYPIEKAAADPSLLRGLQIPRALQTSTEKTIAYLWVEYRQGLAPYDVDFFPSQAHDLNGALVHYTNPAQMSASGDQTYGSDNTTILLNFVPSGPVSPYQKDFTLKGTWKDPHSMVKLQVIQVTPDYLDIQVSFN